MSFAPVHIGNWRPTDTLRISQADATAAKRLLTASKGNVTPDGTMPVGSSLLAGKGLIGGTRLHALMAMNAANAANTIRRWIGTGILSKAADMGAVGVTAGSTPTISRTVGSFLADGWLVGDGIILEGAANRENNVASQVMAVTATTLQLSAAAITTAQAANPAISLWRGVSGPLSAIAASAGAAAATPPLDLLTDNMPITDATPNRHLILGAGTALFFSLGTGLSAGQFVDIWGIGGDY